MLDPHSTQLAVMLQDSPSLRALVEATETIIQRRGILHHARMTAFALAADRSNDMPAATRALLLIAARSERDLHDVVLVVVSMMRGRRGLSHDFDAHIDSTLARLATSIGHGYDRKGYLSIPSHVSTKMPPIDLSISAGRIASVVVPPEWAFEYSRPVHPMLAAATASVVPRVAAPLARAAQAPSASGSDDDAWACAEVSDIEGATAFVDPDRPPLPALDSRKLVNQLSRVSSLECVHPTSQPV